MATHLATVEPNEPAHAGLPAAHSNWVELQPFAQAGTLELHYMTFTHTPGAPWGLDRPQRQRRFAPTGRLHR